MENTNSKTIIIVGSSSQTGNTARISKSLAEKNNWDYIDLNDYNISYYDYNHKNKEDDFLPLIEDILNNYDTLVFSTPIYWYSMSAIMKTFFDRVSDLLNIRKDLGYQLKSKNMKVISNCHFEELDYDFDMPFRKSATYLGMNYLGHQHYCNKTETKETINQ